MPRRPRSRRLLPWCGGPASRTSARSACGPDVADCGTRLPPSGPWSGQHEFPAAGRTLNAAARAAAAGRTHTGLPIEDEDTITRPRKSLVTRRAPKVRWCGSQAGSQQASFSCPGAHLGARLSGLAGGRRAFHRAPLPLVFAVIFDRPGARGSQVEYHRALNRHEAGTRQFPARCRAMPEKEAGAPACTRGTLGRALQLHEIEAYAKPGPSPRSSASPQVTRPYTVSGAAF